MADEDDAQKTEEPTSKKLEKAREQGQVAKSTEVNSWFLLMGGTITQDEIELVADRIWPRP